jgi:hypothetical protein
VNHFVAIFAEIPNDLKPSKVPGLVATDMILVIGLAALLFAGLISWIVFVRGPRKHPSEKRTVVKPPPPAVTITEDGRERHRKKKRSKRRDHRQRNPTLSQTGGLPPPRDPEQSPTI